MAEEAIAVIERNLMTRIGNLESLVSAIDTRCREITVELATSRENMSGLVTQAQEKLQQQEEKLTVAAQQLQTKVESFRTRKATIKATY